MYKDIDTHVRIWEIWGVRFLKLRLLYPLIYVFLLFLFKNLPKLTDRIQSTLFFFFNFFFGCVGSSFLCEGFLQLWRVGATLHRSARASHCCGLSLLSTAPDAQTQQLWLTGPVAPRHVGSSQTRARTRVPCIGRQTLNHCATREVPNLHFLMKYDIYCKDVP